MTFLALEVDAISFPKDCLKKHRDLFLEELEPTCILDYLFQYEVFDIYTHDEIEQSLYRLTKAELVLDHISNKSNQCLNIFMGILKLANQENILHMIKVSENGLPLKCGGKICFVLENRFFF